MADSDSELTTFQSEIGLALTFVEPSDGYLVFQLATLLEDTNRLLELGSVVDSQLRTDQFAEPVTMRPYQGRFRSLTQVRSFHYASDPVLDIAFRGLEGGGIIASVYGAIRGVFYLYDMFQNARYSTVETSVKIAILRRLASTDPDDPEDRNRKYDSLERAARVVQSLGSVDPSMSLADLQLDPQINPIAQQARQLQNRQHELDGPNP